MSTRYGLQGRVDATAHVDLLPAHGVQASSAPPRRMLMPVEIKSGREYIDHHMQVVLYSLLMPERYDDRGHSVDERNGGLLIYLKTGALQGVVVPDRELNAGALC